MTMYKNISLDNIRKKIKIKKKEKRRNTLEMCVGSYSLPVMVVNKTA